MSKPTILVTNDDGFRAPGLQELADELTSIGEVWVVAPDSEQSGVSHTLSLHNPLRVTEHKPRRMSVTGSPADSVYLALNEILDEKPDICVSGINHGANLADDLIYSGTVAGAVEATLADIPGIAVSLAGHGALQFDVAAEFARQLTTEILERGLPRDVYLNANVPGDATRETEARIVKLGRRSYRRDVTEKHDPYERPYYWLGGSELGFDDMPGSDCNAITHEHITITPVHLDFTHYSFMREMRDWNLQEWMADDE